MTPDRNDQDLGDLRLGATPAEDAELSQPEPPRRRGRPPRAILFAGVAGACAMGVGLGLWARPSPHDRGIAVVAPEPEAPTPDPAARHLTIVVNDGPAAQVGAPIETLRPAPQPLFASLRPKGQGAMGEPPRLTRLEPKPLPHIELPKLALPHLQAPHLEASRLPDLAPLAVAVLAAPVHWLQGLKPQHAPVETARAAPETPRAAGLPARRIQLATAERDARTAEVQAERDAERQAAAAERAEARREQLAEAAQARAEAAREARQARLEEARLEKAEQARQAKLEQAKVEQARAEQAQLQQAKLEQARAARAEKLRLAQAQKAQKAEALRLAQAEAKGRAEARAEAKAMVLAEARDEAKKRERLEALVKAVRRALPHANVETARMDKAPRGRHEEAQVQRASLKARRGPHNVEPPGRTHPVQLAPSDPSGLVKVSTARCASRDPGAALVCADPALTAADRQLARAYQGARAAGVPEGQLQAQQQRWLAARTTAAREAPWALRDVYLARIAELNSQARDAHATDY